MRSDSVASHRIVPLHRCVLVSWRHAVGSQHHILTVPRRVVSRSRVPLPRPWGDRHPGTGPGPGGGRGGRRDTSARPRGTGGCQTPPAAPAGWDGTGQPEEPCPPGPGAAKSSARWQRSGTDPLFLAGTPLLFAGVSFSPASACWKLAPAGGPVCARILASPARPFLSGFYPWGIFCDACVVHSG